MELLYSQLHHVVNLLCIFFLSKYMVAVAPVNIRNGAFTTTRSRTRAAIFLYPRRRSFVCEWSPSIWLVTAAAVSELAVFNAAGIPSRLCSSGRPRASICVSFVFSLLLFFFSCQVCCCGYFLLLINLFICFICFFLLFRRHPGYARYRKLFDIPSARFFVVLRVGIWCFLPRGHNLCRRGPGVSRYRPASPWRLILIVSRSNCTNSFFFYFFFFWIQCGMKVCVSFFF